MYWIPKIILLNFSKPPHETSDYCPQTANSAIAFATESEPIIESAEGEVGEMQETLEEEHQEEELESEIPADTEMAEAEDMPHVEDEDPEQQIEGDVSQNDEEEAL